MLVFVVALLLMVVIVVVVLVVVVVVVLLLVVLVVVVCVFCLCHTLPAVAPLSATPTTPPSDNSVSSSVCLVFYLCTLP